MSEYSITSRTVVLAEENIDTDQIIPARFLTTTSRSGLGEHLFHAWRFDVSGKPRPDFVLNKAEAADCRILVAGHNFGCGSSREHAAWALADFGIRAVISTGIADIFRSNALKNGIVPVVVEEDIHDWLLENPGTRVTIDVAGGTVQLADGRTCPLPIDAFARHCLVNDLDELGFLLTQSDAIAAYEEKLQR